MLFKVRRLVLHGSHTARRLEWDGEYGKAADGDEAAFTDLRPDAYRRACQP